MTKITIEVDGSEVQSSKDTDTQQPGAAVGGAGAASAEVLAQADAIGALNAGPAPSMGSPSGSAPIAASVTEPSMESSHPTVSAGAAPEHLFV